MTKNIQWIPIRLSADFSTKTLQVRREWHDIFKVMKGKNLQPRIFYPARLSFGFDGKIKSFPENQSMMISPRGSEQSKTEPMGVGMGGWLVNREAWKTKKNQFLGHGQDSWKMKMKRQLLEKWEDLSILISNEQYPCYHSNWLHL